MPATEMDFKELYITWYSRVRNFALTYVNDADDAADIVEEVFMKLYERRDELQAGVNVVSYLFASVRHACLNHLRERLALSRFQTRYKLETQLRYDALMQLDAEMGTESDIEQALQRAIDALPERCREIFVMSRLQGMPQEEVAQRLGITVNTVETQMGIAYRRLRDELKGSLALLFFLFFT